MNDISEFNNKNRISNSIKNSFFGGLRSVLDILLGFIYRTVFINTLTAEYLGLNGLFTDVLQVLSLAEMGITVAIVFRFYEPISNKDVLQVGKIMNYLKIVYRNITCIILGLGLIIMPFIKYLIKDLNSVPKDINIYCIYLLFLVNSITSYIFVYKQTILNADQKLYITCIFGIAISILKYLIQIVILVVLKNFSLTLLVGIIITILLNYLFSIWTEKKYKKVFSIKEELSKNDRNQIINDTKAILFHKVGATVKLSTDSLVLSKFVSLVSAGIYSNYSMIINGIQTVIGQLLGNIVSSVGSAHVELSNKENYKVYKRLLFLDLWISTDVLVCTYLILNEFIKLWIGNKYLFDKFTLIMLCMQFFILISRQINICYINGCGLFVRDKYRPIIEAIINLVLSIIGVQLCGIAGVFVGTVVSSLVTVFWREPYILFNDEFSESVINYWKLYFLFCLIAIILCFIGDYIKKEYLSIDSFVCLIIATFLLFIITNFVLFVIFHKSEEFIYLKTLFIDIIKNKLHR